ncbi:MAG: metallophosphoesterase [Microthrixaceae bacterium]
MAIERLLALCAVLAAFAAVLVVQRLTGRSALALWTLPVAVCVLGIGAVLSAVVGVAQGLDMFGLIHLAYVFAVVAVPLSGAGLLVLAARQGAAAAVVVAASLMLLPAPIGIYATHIAPYLLHVDERRVPVPAARDGDDPVRIGVLADLQTSGVGDHERAAVRALMEARPDVIVLPGDLFQADDDTLRRKGPAARELLAQLQAPGGVYFVEGDVDRHDRLSMLLPPNITRLEDEVVTVHLGDRTLHLGGTDLDHTSPAADAVRDELRASTGALTVLVSHRPDTVLGLPADAGVDLVVAGHTHGGQLALPRIGAPMTLSAVPRAVGSGGLHEVHGNPIYVSSGVGIERGQAPQFRFGVRPSIGLLLLEG